MNRLKDYITKNLIYAGLSKEEYELIQYDVQKENRNGLMTFSAITVVFLLGECEKKSVKLIPSMIE